MDTSQEDAAGKRFSPPPPGLAALYIYRDVGIKSAIAIDLSGPVVPVTSEPASAGWLEAAAGRTPPPIVVAAGLFIVPSVPRHSRDRVPAIDGHTRASIAISGAGAANE